MSAPLITMQLKHNTFTDVQAQLLNRKVEDAKDEITTNANNIASILNGRDVATYVQYIQTLENKIRVLEGAVGSEKIQNIINGKTEQKNYDNDISSLKSTDTQLRSGINSLNTSLKTVNNDLTTLEDDFTEMEENMKNLVPSGAVMYFDLTACPKGWTASSSKYPKAANAFIRNLSGSGRTIGAWQQNAAPEIQGTFDGNVNDNNGAKTGAFYRISEENFGADGAYEGGKVGFKASKSSAVYGRENATEVRPDNIALLACRKN